MDWWSINVIVSILIIAAIVVGLVFAFKKSGASDSSTKSLENVEEEESCSYGEVKENKKCAISPGGACHNSNNQCVDGYICDASEGICVKDL
jgi:hypothetical protein